MLGVDSYTDLLFPQLLVFHQVTSSRNIFLIKKAFLFFKFLFICTK
jgi:hypothetical protein